MRWPGERTTLHGVSFAGNKLRPPSFETVIRRDHVLSWRVHAGTHLRADTLRRVRFRLRHIACFLIAKIERICSFVPMSWE